MKSRDPKFFYARTKSRTEGDKVFRGKPILCVAYRIIGKTIAFGFAIPNPKLPLSRPQIRKVALTRLESGKSSERKGSCGGTHWLNLDYIASPEQAIQAIHDELLKLEDYILPRVIRQLAECVEPGEVNEVSDTDPPSYPNSLDMYPPLERSMSRFGPHY